MRKRGAFFNHLAEAIVVNRARRPIYAHLTKGRSRRLSTLLIFLEQMLLPFAWGVDVWARRFNRRGIPIVRDDFAPMLGLSSPETPPRYTHRMTETQRHSLVLRLKPYRRDVLRCFRRGELRLASLASQRLLGDIVALEASWCVHLAMTKHLVESVTLSAMRAPHYAVTSQGATRSLSALMILSQALLFPIAPTIDRWAQSFHAEGVAILVNDLPGLDRHLRSVKDLPARPVRGSIPFHV